MKIAFWILRMLGFLVISFETTPPRRNWSELFDSSIPSFQLIFWSSLWEGEMDDKGMKLICEAFQGNTTLKKLEFVLIIVWIEKLGSWYNIVYHVIWASRMSLLSPWRSCSNHPISMILSWLKIDIVTGRITNFNK
jgi:hypothetical protein